MSTVDSGNLAASLVALAQGLLALAEQPQNRAVLVEGLIDTADLLAAASSSSPAPDPRSRDLIARVNRLAREVTPGIEARALR